jgi:hypothetical protein
VNTRRAIRSLIRAHEKERIAPPPDIVALLQACDRAAAQLPSVSESGHRDATSVVPLQSSLEDNIGTREAAMILQISQRHVQRLAATLDGRRLSSGTWVFDRSAVLAYAQAAREIRSAS